jgi:hypothetical protein
MFGFAASRDVINMTIELTRSIYASVSKNLTACHPEILTKASAAVANSDKEPVDIAAYI